MHTLIIFSHTFWADSKVNKALLQQASTLQNVVIHNLSTTYENAKIDIESELKLLEKADKIIFQFPLFWFSTPSIMKEWQDRVLSKILYGANAKMLQGKKFQIITTLGGNKESYDGHHGYSLESLLSPITSSFAYMGCEVLESYGIFSANAEHLPLQEYLALLQ